MKRGAKRIAAGVAALLGLLAVLGAWVVWTESGLRVTWRLVAGFVPAEIEVGAVDGRLAGPLVLRDVRYAAEDLRASVERIELEWQPRTLLRGLLSVAYVRATGVDVVRLPAAPQPDGEPFELPERLSLPIDVDVELVAVEAVRFRAAPDAEPILVDDGRFSLRWFRDSGIAVDALEVNAPLFDVAGRAEVRPSGPYPTELELDATVRPPGRPAAEASLRSAGTLDELRVRLDVEPPYSLQAEVVVADVLGRLALDGTLDARLAPADIGLEVPVSATTVQLVLAGPLDDLRVSGRADAEIPELFDVSADLSAHWLGSVLDIETLEIAEQDGPASVRLGGRVELGSAPSATLGGEWSGLRWPLDGEPIAESRRGTVELAGTLAQLEARLAAGWDDNGRIEGVVRRDGERLDVELDWRDVSWPATEPRLESSRGALQVSGTFDDYALALDAELAGAEDPANRWRAEGAAGHLRAEGRGDRRRFDLALVDVAVLDGSLEGSGRFDWEPSLAAAMDVEFTRLDPGLLVPEWNGRIDGSIEADAAVADDGLAADIERLEVAGTLRGRPIDLSGRGRYEAPNRGNVDEMTLRSGTSTLVVAGSFGQEIDVEWRVDSPNLDDFWPGLAGSLSTSGQATGPLLQPRIDADAAGESIVLDGIEIGALSLAASVDVAGVAESDLTLDVRDARIAGRSIERLELEGDGTAARHRLAADVSVDGVESAIALRGAFERPWESDYAWRFELDEGRIAHPSLPEWTLDSPAAGLLTADGAELARSCFRSGDASLCIDAARRGARTDVGLELDALSFRQFAAYLPPDTRITGEVSAEGRLELAPDLAPRATLTLATTPARITGARVGTAVPALAFAAGRAVFDFDGERLDVDLELPLARGNGGIDGRAAVVLRAGEAVGASDLDATLRAELDDLAFVSELASGVDATAGALSMDVAVSGTVGAPRVAGNVLLREGTARLREPGIVVEQLDVALVGDGSGQLTIDASAVSGEGSIEADGVVRIVDTLAVGRLALRGDAFELANTPDARLWASPDLALEMTEERIDLTGSVLIPRARLTPRDPVAGAVSPSNDQIIVDDEEIETRPFSRPFYARVALSLGEDVTFDGFGLTGTLRGALEVVEVPAEPVTGSGELRVESGTYEAYGQELEVRTGRLLFAGGPVARPGLDIEAVRRPTEDILVGARVRGTLDRPELSVFSEPSMARSEQLSYLLLGRPLETASGSETSALSQAAMALGLRGGNFVSERLNRALRFDEFGIQTQPAQASAASFVIGKYLTPSLYVSYGVGLFEPVNTLRLRYTISRRWRLVTESSTSASGGDLIYHIERGD